MKYLSQVIRQNRYNVGNTMNRKDVFEVRLAAGGAGLVARAFDPGSSVRARLPYKY